MIISQVTGSGRYVKSTTEAGVQKSESASSTQTKDETAAQGREDVFIRADKSETTDVTDYRSLKKLSGSQIKAMKDRRAESMKRLVTEMLGRQAAKTESAQSAVFEKLSGTAESGQSDWMSQYLDPEDTPETAAQAISKDGEWGVNAVATRLLDMAVSLSGGDVSKIAELRSAVEAGFKAAGDVLGGTLPGVCQDTYTETMNRFDYWEQHGSMDGYTMV